MNAPMIASFAAIAILASGSGDATFERSVEGCTVTWTHDRSGAIRHRSRCVLPLDSQSELVGELLRVAPAFQRLDWGRLLPDGPADTALAYRLAVAALRSHDWDRQRGVPRGGAINNWVRARANEAMIYRELQAIFRAAGLDLRLSVVEKVLVLPAGKLPFFDKLRDAGARAQDKVPFDCQAWFSVAPRSRP